MARRTRACIGLAACAAGVAAGRAPPSVALRAPGVIPNNSASVLNWAPLGEAACGGDITAVRVNPYNTSQVFIGGDMLGTMVSLDGGSTWTAPTWDSFLGYEMADFTFDPVLRRIYLASLSGPYFASFDDPLTWTSIRNGFPAPGWGTHTGTTQVILVDPASQGQRLVGIGGNKRQWDDLGGLGLIWESTNAGANWTNVVNITTRSGSGPNIMAAEWCGDGAGIWAFASGAGAFFSAGPNAGRSWVNMSNGLPSLNFGSGGAHGGNCSVAYAAMGDGNGVWRTRDGGASWQDITSPPLTSNGGSMESFAVSASDPDVLFAGNGGNQGATWISHDGGDTWVQSGPPPSFQAYGLGLGSSFASIDPTNSSVIYQATWVTLWRSQNSGANWTDLTAFRPNTSDTTGTIWRGTGFSGLVSTNVAWNKYSTATIGYPRAFVQGMDAGKIWGAADADLYAWRRQSGLQEFGGGNTITFGADGYTMYAGTGQFSWSRYYSTEGVVKSVDGGDTWSYACSYPNSSDFGPYTSIASYFLETLPHNTSTLWTVFQNNKLYYSDNGCGNWTLVPALNDTAAGILLLSQAENVTDPAQAQVVVPGYKGVWVSGPGWTTGGLNNFTLLPGSPTAWQYSTNWCGQSRYNPEILMCANSWWDQWHSGLWRGNLTTAKANLAAGGSGNSGWDRLVNDYTIYRWTDTESGLQAYASNLNPYPEESPASGVWVSIDDGQTWSQQNIGLRMRRIAVLSFSPDGSKLVAGMNGGGFAVADTTALQRARAEYLAAKAQRA